MADWAGASGAGGAADALQQILVNKLMQAKFDEQKRQALAQEAAQAAERQQRADEFRASQGQRMTEFVADRDRLIRFARETLECSIAYRSEMIIGRATRNAVATLQNLSGSRYNPNSYLFRAVCTA